MPSSEDKPILFGFSDDQVVSTTHRGFGKHVSLRSFTTMHRTSTANFIENMAHEQIRYETIFGDQAKVLRADLPKFEAAMARIQQSPLIAKRGQRWEPTQDDVDEYLAHCDDICRLVPQDFEELSLFVAKAPEQFSHLTRSVASKSCMQLMQPSCASSPARLGGNMIGSSWRS